MAQRIHVEGTPDRVRRPDRGAKQDEQGHRARGGLDGAAPQADGLVRPHLVGTPIYKMTGSGNDFVMVDGRHAAPGDWSPEDIRAVCARGTGVGGDGLGVPHLVVLVQNVDGVDVDVRGKALRSDPALGPAGANVNFISAGASPSEWRMRTYERGVEAETLACGTGAVAAVCALSDWGLAEPPMTILTRSGRRLEIRARKAPEATYDDIWLVGEARLVLRGVIN